MKMKLQYPTALLHSRLVLSQLPWKRFVLGIHWLPSWSCRLVSRYSNTICVERKDYIVQKDTKRRFPVVWKWWWSIYLPLQFCRRSWLCKGQTENTRRISLLSATRVDGDSLLLVLAAAKHKVIACRHFAATRNCQNGKFCFWIYSDVDTTFWIIVNISLEFIKFKVVEFRWNL